MGKGKGGKVEHSSSAFIRMNYLFQASQLMSKCSPTTSLSSFYGRLMKEVSKKVVEKIHPEIKRVFCTSCSYPLLGFYENAKVTLKTHKRKHKKKKRKQSNKKLDCKSVKLKCFKGNNEQMEKRLKPSYLKSRIDQRNRKPNRLMWCCEKCGYTRTILQRPNFQPWFEKDNVISNH